MFKTAKYILILLLYSSCSNPGDNTVSENISLYSPPETFALDTVKGYTINKLTGDSIKPLLNSFGDTIKTGVPLPFKGTVVNSGSRVQPEIIKATDPPKQIIPANVHPVPTNLTIIPVDTSQFKKVKLGEGDPSFVLRNSKGILPTGVPIPIRGKKMPVHEPEPVKALPLRFKDEAKTNIQYLDVDQGLSYSFIYDLLEDKNGNLWFGMDGTGVCKFDGLSFTNYTVKEGLTNNIISSMLEDRKGNIWIATFSGITLYDGEYFVQFAEEEGMTSSKTLSLMEDKSGNMWFTTEGSGVCKYDGKNFTYYTTKEGLPSDTVMSCMEDKKGNLWFGTVNGVVRFDGREFTWISFKDNITGGYARALLEDKDGNIWIGSGKEGLYKYDGKNFTRFSEREGLSKNIIWSLLNDRNGNLWISTTFGGINKFDGKRFTWYGIKEGLSNSKVRDMAEDKNGNIWFGTDGGGVNKLHDAGFSYLVPEAVMGNNRVRPIFKDNSGNLWFGTEGGGVGKLDAISRANGDKEFTYYTSMNNILPIDGQRSFLQDKKGNLWIGTMGGGAIKYDGRNFSKYSLKEGLSDMSIFSLLEDRGGNIWMGTSTNGIDRFDGKNFIHYSEKDGLPAKRIFSMLEDKKGNLWFCTEGGGISKYDGTNIINYTEKEGLLNKSVTSITEDKNGNLWLGTSGTGVCRFDGKSFSYYTEKQGLSNNNVWSVLQDSSGHIWMGTDKGLNRFVPDTGNDKYTIYSFGLQDGLKAIDFNLRSVCIDNNNRIWWGTGKGVVSLDLNREYKADDVRSLKLNYITINEQVYDYRNFPDSLKNKVRFSTVSPFNNYPERLSLAYDQNHLDFHFSAIDWSAPEKIKYSYRLVGLENKWSNPSEATTAEYRNLGYGHYQFQVKAIGRSQSWTMPFVYSFAIKPAWWQTWWFKTLASLAVLLLTFILVRVIYLYRIRKQKAQLEKQLAVQMERQRISAEMHDDIGAGLSGVRLLTEMTKNKMKDSNVSSEVEKIYQSVGDISARMKEVIWSLNAENDHLENLLAYMQKQARAMLEHYPGGFSIEMPEKIPSVMIDGKTRRNIYLSVKEALHNCIKHSGADKIEMKIDCREKLMIAVSDNGKGITEPEKTVWGNGLKNMRRRMEEIGGEFIIKNKSGLTLTFLIPLKFDT